jgi:hypothetical protein
VAYRKSTDYAKNVGQSEGGGRIKNFRAYVGDRLVEPKAPQ